MEFVHSTDGTSIAYERSGDGPLLILVPGVFNDHQRLKAIADQLALDYTVINYDRRARGASGDNSPYSTDKELEDLSALMALGNSPARLFGYSSGGVLALLAATRGAPVSKVAVYEPPYGIHNEHRPADLPQRLMDLVADGQPGDAVELFQTKAIGLPPEVVAHMRQSPMWPALEAMAPSTVYDALLTEAGAVGDEALASLDSPVLILSGAETWPNLSASADALAAIVGSAERQVLPGGDGHDPDATPLVPTLLQFFE